MNGATSNSGGHSCPLVALAHRACLVQFTRFRSDAPTAQHRVYRLCDVRVDGDAVPTLYLDEHVKGRWSLAFEDRLLGAPPPCFLVSQGHGLHAPDEVGERRVDQQVLQRVAVGRRDQLHASFCDGPRRDGLQLRAHLVYDDDLRHVVLHCLDHDCVLAGRRGHLHPPCLADGGMGDVAVSRDLVGRVHDDDALPGVCKDARQFTEDGGLADTRPSDEEDALAGEREVFDDAGASLYCAPHPACQADDLSAPVPDSGDAVQCALDACPVVVTESPTRAVTWSRSSLDTSAQPN